MIAYWQLDGNLAALVSSATSAKIDLSQPDQGLALTCKDSQPASLPLHILGMTVAERTPLPPLRIDSYTRGADLVATYGEVPSHRLRSQVYWRCVTAGEVATNFATSIIIAFDLLLSSNSSLLDSDPRSNVRSQLPGITEVIHFNRSETSSASYERCAQPISLPMFASGSRQIAFTPDGGGPGCFLCRFQHGKFSYLEMVHPADFCGTEIGVTGSPQAEQWNVQIEHQLFHQRLEKGVILRARVRSAIIARHDDEAVSLAAFQQFASAEPPLTV